jgi:guanine deaminase
LQDKAGNFVVGKEFDALLIDPSVKGRNVDIFEEDAQDWDRVLSKWAFNGYVLASDVVNWCRDDQNIQKVWVQGRLVASRRHSTLPMVEEI